MNVKIQVVLIGTLGGLVGGGVTTVASHFFGLEASRQELLQTARRNAYVEWLEVRLLGVQADDLREENREEEADSVREEFDLKGRQVLGRIAVYGDQNVVRAVATWVRTFEEKIEPCTFQQWAEDIAVYQKMRGSLIPEEQAVSDTDLSVILFQCSEPTAR